MNAATLVHRLLDSSPSFDELKYWLSPKGERIKCSGEHGTVASQILGLPVLGATQDDRLMHTTELRDKLMRRGYARINILPGKHMWVDCARRLTRAQKDAITEWSAALGIEATGAD